jgi:hypothetical protein
MRWALAVTLTEGVAVAEPLRAFTALTVVTALGMMMVAPSVIEPERPKVS